MKSLTEKQLMQTQIANAIGGIIYNKLASGPINQSNLLQLN